MAVIEYTTGPAGTGKSYERCARFIGDRYFRDHAGSDPPARHISNFPIVVATMAEWVSKKCNLLADDVAARIEVIPDDVMATWRRGESGPWDFFAGKSIDKCHIAFDECHTFIGRSQKPDVKKKWLAWLGEIRHAGATVEFLTQSEAKVASEIESEAALKRVLSSNEERRDPLLGCRVADWYELRAKFITGRYIAATRVQEMRRHGKRWKVEDTTFFWINPVYYPLYDSYAAHSQTGQKSSAHVRQFERRGRLGLIAWFVGRNWERLFWRFGVAVFAVWLLGLGGLNVIIEDFMQGFQLAVAGSASASTADGKPVAGRRSAVSAAVPGVQSGGGASAVVVDREGEEKLARKVAEQRAELKRFKAAAAAERERGSVIVGLAADGVWVEDGEFLRVGDQFQSGRLKGETVEAVLFRDRVVVLRNGDRLPFRLRVTAASRSKGEATGDAGLLRGLDQSGADEAGVGDSAESFSRVQGGGSGVGLPGASQVGRGVGGGVGSIDGTSGDHRPVGGDNRGRPGIIIPPLGSGPSPAR